MKIDLAEYLLPRFVLLRCEHRGFLHSQLRIPSSGKEFPEITKEPHTGQGIFLESISCLKNSNNNSFLFSMKLTSLEFSNAVFDSRMEQSMNVKPE
jgi:hypothetical protein